MVFNGCISVHFIFQSLFQRFKCTCSLLDCLGHLRRSPALSAIAVSFALILSIKPKPVRVWLWLWQSYDAWILLYPYLHGYEHTIYWWLERKECCYSRSCHNTMFNIIFYSSKVYKHNSKSECWATKLNDGARRAKDNNSNNKNNNDDEDNDRSDRTLRKRENTKGLHTHTLNLYRIGSTKEV